jgi:hypothetical protein
MYSVWIQFKTFTDHEGTDCQLFAQSEFLGNTPFCALKWWAGRFFSRLMVVEMNVATIRTAWRVKFPRDFVAKNKLIKFRPIT